MASASMTTWRFPVSNSRFLRSTAGSLYRNKRVEGVIRVGGVIIACICCVYGFVYRCLSVENGWTNMAIICMVWTKKHVTSLFPIVIIDIGESRCYCRVCVSRGGCYERTVWTKKHVTSLFSIVIIDIGESRCYCRVCDSRKVLWEDMIWMKKHVTSLFPVVIIDIMMKSKWSSQWSVVTTDQHWVMNSVD